MTKEKFLFELIDNWLYFISQQCVLMENYIQIDRTKTYEECCHQLKRFFDYYDQVYEKAGRGLRTEEEIDARLEFLIQKWKNNTIKDIISEIEECLCAEVEDKKQFMNQYLFLNQDGKRQDVSKQALTRFVKELRVYEERR